MYIHFVIATRDSLNTMTGKKMLKYHKRQHPHHSIIQFSDSKRYFLCYYTKKKKKKRLVLETDFKSYEIKHVFKVKRQ